VSGLRHSAIRTVDLGDQPGTAETPSFGASLDTSDDYGRPVGGCSSGGRGGSLSLVFAAAAASLFIRRRRRSQ